MEFCAKETFVLCITAKLVLRVYWICKYRNIMVLFGKIIMYKCTYVFYCGAQINC